MLAGEMGPPHQHMMDSWGRSLQELHPLLWCNVREGEKMVCVGVLLLRERMLHVAVYCVGNMVWIRVFEGKCCSAVFGVWLTSCRESRNFPTAFLAQPPLRSTAINYRSTAIALKVTLAGINAMSIVLSKCVRCAMSDTIISWEA